MDSLQVALAVASALPEAAHSLCPNHYVREAGKPIYEADRDAKKELKKRVRGVRKIERTVSQAPGNRMKEVVEGYCHGGACSPYRRWASTPGCCWVDLRATAERH